MSETSKFAGILTMGAVTELADTKTFSRGLAYFREGAVSRFEECESTIRATVQGTDRYRVELAVVDDGRLGYACDCPVGAEGRFCKHVVALALCWLDKSGDETVRREKESATKPASKRKTYLEAIREHIDTLSKDALQKLLLEAVENDVALRDRLLRNARMAQSADLAGMKAVVRQVSRTRRSLDWREAAAYGTSLMSLAETLRQRLAGPYAAQVPELVELAIAGAEKSLEEIDDSGGAVTSAIFELASVYLEACKLIRPDPIKLAERLFALQTKGEKGTFHDILPAYADPLGERGLHRYRELVAQAWEALPALAPHSGQYLSYESRRMSLENAMLALAELDGDADAIIRICAKDLSSSSRFLMVAERCVKHGRPDDALAWAERGLQELGGQPDPRLLDFCVQAYLRRGAFSQADASAWRRFEMHSTAQAFQTLMEVAKATGSHDEMRERALNRLWSCVEKEEGSAPPKRYARQVSTRTQLVKIFLFENENDRAWEAFIGGPVATQLWPEMAAVRGRTHPHDAIQVYRRLLPIALEAGRLHAHYVEAVEVVRAIGKLWTQQGETETFTRELEDIRTTYRAKRNFIKLLAALP